MKNLPDGILDIIGKEYKQADSMAAYLGMVLRVTKRDGKHLIVTADLRGNRVNVGTVNDVVTEIISVG